MSFRVRLGQDLVAVEPGATAAVSVEVENPGPTDDQFELTVEGLDPDWIAVPVPQLNLEAGSSVSEKVFFRPPRASESLAADYPFVVQVRSLETGETRVAQGMLQLKPFHHLALELDPKRGVLSPWRQLNRFGVKLLNLGNTDHTVQFLGNDPEDACAYDFDPAEATVQPGQQRNLEVTVKPKQSSLVSSARLFGFSITGRSVNHPSAVATAQGQLETRSLFSPGSLLLLLLAAGLGWLWFINLPKSPSIRLTVEPREVVRGGLIKVRWTAQNAGQVTIQTESGKVIYDGTFSTGESEYPVTESDTVVFQAVARNQGLSTSAEPVAVKVREPEVVPEPRIQTLEVDRSRIRLGESFILRYKFGPGVASAVLGPVSQELNLALTSVQITPNQVGNIDYEVVATNKLGRTARRGFRVTVYEESEAGIVSFTASSLSVGPGDAPITLAWQTSGAARVVLSTSTGLNETVDSEGRRDFMIAANTRFTLTAFDVRGRAVSRTLRVAYLEPVAEPEPETPTDTNPGEPFPETVPPLEPPPKGPPPTNTTGTPR
jgi:hypothetical protein